MKNSEPAHEYHRMAPLAVVRMLELYHQGELMARFAKHPAPSDNWEDVYEMTVTAPSMNVQGLASIAYGLLGILKRERTEDFGDTLDQAEHRLQNFVLDISPDPAHDDLTSQDDGPHGSRAT